MWTVDPRAHQNTNEAHALFHFNQLPVFHDIKARLLFSVFNHSHISSDVAQHMFGELVRKTHAMSDGDMEVTFDEKLANVEELSTVN